MTGPEVEENTGASGEGRPFPRQRDLEELQHWLDWLKSLVAVGSTLSRLANVEVSLALGDLRRLIGLSLLALPFLCFAWLGLSTLLAWSVYALTSSVGAGLAGFFLLQCLVLAVIALLVRRYKKHLALPRTREQLQSIIRDFEDGPKKPGGTDPTT